MSADARPSLAPWNLHHRSNLAIQPVRRIGRTRPLGLCGLALVAAPATASALDISEKLELNGLIAGAYQCQQVSGAPDVENACRGGLALQPELSYAPTEAGRFFVKLGLGLGNGLNNISPFELAPWAADLEADVQDINGSGRSYLLEARYAHTFTFGEGNRIQLAAGIIDPSAFLNTNAYANDEFTQFSNQAFVNARNLLLPAYDWGGALVWEVGDWTFSGVGMSVAENEDGAPYNWSGAEVAYHLDSHLGEGTYRILYSATSQDFSDESGTGQEPLSGLILSFDQALGEIVGIFVRAAWQLTDGAGTYQSGYEGGCELDGRAWGREADNIGIAYGHAHGGNSEIFQSDVVEAYYRFAVSDTLALTLDVQWMKDSYRNAEDISGWIPGIRAVAQF